MLKFHKKNIYYQTEIFINKPAQCSNPLKFKLFKNEKKAFVNFKLMFSVAW